MSIKILSKDTLPPVVRPPFWKLKKDARELLRDNWNKSVLTVFISFIFYAGVTVKLFSGKNYEEIFLFMSSNAFDVITIFLMITTSVGQLAVIHGFFQIHKGEKQSVWKNYFAALKNIIRFIPYIAIIGVISYLSGKLGSRSDINQWYDLIFFTYIYDYQVYTFICGVVSTVLFILAYYLSVAMLFVPHIITENTEISGIEAIGESFRITKKIKWRLLFLSVSFVLWYCLGLFALIIGYLWAFVYYQSTIFVYYINLSVNNAGVSGAGGVIDTIAD